MSRASYNAELKAAVSTVLAGRGVTPLATIEAALPASIARPARTTLAKIVSGLGWRRVEQAGAASYQPPACACEDCRGLDREHPHEGQQLLLLSGDA